MPRADGKGGVFDIKRIPADGGQSIIGNIALDGSSEADGFAITNGCNVNAAVLELVDECLIMIGTHTGPASVLHLGIEDVY